MATHSSIFTWENIVTEHALILCRETGRPSTLDKGHEEGGSAYANVGSSLRSPPGCSRASPPKKNQSLPTVLFCGLTSGLTGGCPPPPSRSLCQRVNLQLQFIKFLVILPFNFQLSLHLEHGTHHARSEERRVGKECRSRWSPY